MTRSATLNPIRLLWAFVVLVAAILVSFEVWHESDQRENEVRQTELAVMNVARAIQREAEDTFKLADTILFGIVERLRAGGASPEGLARLSRSMALGVARIGIVKDLFVYDETGRWIASSLPALPAGANNADRDYFRHHAAHPGQDAFLGEPVVSRSAGTWILTVSRRIDRPDGSFGGVVLATIDVAQLARRFATFNVGREGSVALLDGDGRILIRLPDVERYVGRSVPTVPFTVSRTVDENATVGSYTSPIDGVVRIAGYVRATKYPLQIYAAVSRREALAAWRSSAVARGLVVAILTIVVLMLGARLAAFMRRQAATEARYRLLAENSGDVVSSTGAGGVLRYVSPAALPVLGVAPDRLTGASLATIVAPRSALRLQAAARRLGEGRAETVALRHRETRPDDGRPVWLETTVRLAKPAGAGADEYVAVTRDVTGRKHLEERLAASARTDALTGIANRRAFDERLAAEWRRSRHDGTPLAVVLLDLDRFKLFNDTYGHLAGDACLARVASIVSGQIDGGRDLAARYGGEELAVILPRCDRPAEIVAERLRASVAAAGLPHAGNAPSGAVTISAGVAVRWPSRVAAGPDSLVQAADEALYAAKRAGRNRVRSARADLLRAAG